MNPSPSEAARARMRSCPGEPLLLSDWDRVLMIHLEVDPEELQRDVPFPLDLWQGRAFVSLVAFTIRRVRPWALPGAWLLKPIATHEFLNLRAYVRLHGEPGIHFLAEWLPNRLAVKLGPSSFGLPYRWGRIAYEHDWRPGALRGTVVDRKTANFIRYRAGISSSTSFKPCEAGSLDEWLMEKYTAFNCRRNRKQFFRVWHPPWLQCPVDVKLESRSLLTADWPWLSNAPVHSANFSPGLQNVWLGWPHALSLEHSGTTTLADSSAPSNY